jgi:hypothetical protein
MIPESKVWPDGTLARAWFDDSRRYRYRLERDFQPGMLSAVTPVSRTVTFIMLNPSTADALKNDPSVARCSAFAKRWGYARLIVVNLFALRSTDPRALRCDADPVGPKNDLAIKQANLDSLLTIAAWGVHGVERNRRDIDVIRALDDAGRFLHCLGRTKDGHPKHPLYLRGDVLPERFDPIAEARERTTREADVLPVARPI